MVAKVHDEQDAVGRDTHAAGSIHLLGPAALRAELALEEAIGREDLDAVVARVRHNDVALGVDTAALGPHELPVAAALATQELGRLQVTVDHEQPVVVEVGDDDLTLGVEADAARRVELLPQRAVEAVLGHEVARGREELNAVIARVRDENVGARTLHRHVPRVVEEALQNRKKKPILN